MSSKTILVYDKENKKYLFNRRNLIKGINRQGFIIPSGGIILKNGNLAGYVQNGGQKEWNEIGRIFDYRINKIPSYKNLRKIQGSHNSLKNAIKNLKNYYINELN